MDKRRVIEYSAGMKAIELFNANMSRAEKLLDLHRKAYSRGRPAAGAEGDEILRSAVVFAISALDAYMHLRVEQVVGEIIFKNRRVPERILPCIQGLFSEKEVTRELLKVAVSKDPQKSIIRCLNSALAGRTFQKPQQIHEAMKMMEVGRPSPEINVEYARLRRGPRRIGRPRSVESMLGELASRRDNIVHEGDMYTSNVGNRYHGRLRPISRTWVDGHLRQLRKIVRAIETVSKIP